MGKELEQIEAPVRKVSPIIEVAAANYQHLRLLCGPERGVSLKEKFEAQTFDGVEVHWSSTPHIPQPEEICQVPHFGHSISCEGPCYGGGVFRLFETQFLISEDTGGEGGVIGGRWEIGEGIEIAVSHSGRVVTEAELEKLAADGPVVGRFGKDYSPEEPGPKAGGKLDEQRTSMGLCADSNHQGTLSSY